ncbi:hypothetical protein TcWFU_001560 [Taenia crassiceps]
MWTSVRVTAPLYQSLCQLTCRQHHHYLRCEHSVASAPAPRHPWLVGVDLSSMHPIASSTCLCSSITFTCDTEWTNGKFTMRHKGRTPLLPLLRDAQSMLCEGTKCLEARNMATSSHGVVYLRSFSNCLF